MSQTLSAGLTAQQKHTLSWAYTGPVPASGPSGTLGIMKHGGAGGSHFIQSIPNCLILNADLTTVVHHPLRAMMWPLVINNVALEPDPAAPGDLSRARPLKLEWDSVTNPGTGGIMEKVNLLVKLAAENQPRPAWVAIDTVETVLSITQPWIGAKFGKDFLDLGEAGWSRRKSQFWDRLYWPLRWSGYNIILLMQLFTDAKDVLAPDGRSRISKEYPNTPKVSASFSKEIRDICNLVSKIEPHEEPGGSVEKQPDGTSKFVSRPTRKWKMVFHDAFLGDLVKARTGLPDSIDITGTDPWKKFATAWETAANSDIEKSKLVQ